MANGSENGSMWDRLRGGGDRPKPATPWRVEGVRGDPPQEPERKAKWARFWWLLVVLLIVNWIVSSLLIGPAPRTKVSYTFFVSQVDARNVSEITSTAD